MQRTYDITAVGAALVDTEIQVSDDDLKNLGIAKGMMTLVDEAKQAQYLTYLREHIDSAHRACGGSAANTLIASSYMGCKNFMTCRVADDDYGDIFLGDLERAGIDYNHNSQRVAGDTGKCLVMLTPDAERSMNTCLGVSAELDASSLHPEVIADSKWVYIEGYLATSPGNLDAATKTQELARESGTRIALSLSDPGIAAHFRDQLKAMAGGKIDMLFCNREEALAWTEQQDFDAALDALKEASHSVAVTMGADGAIISHGGQDSQVSSPKVKAIDTNGAGDSFAGAYLAAIIRGATAIEAAEFACKTAAELVQFEGPRLGGDAYRELASASAWHAAAN
jgi:sugar/nucleoside kinase (ribokinase family)